MPAARRARRRRATPIARPNGDVQKLSRRWAEEARIKMAHAMLKVLTEEEADELRAGGPFPTTNQKRFEDLYKEQYPKILAEIRKEDNKWGKRNTELTYNGLKKAVKRYTKQLLMKNNVHNKPPHSKGYKIERNWETLDAIYHLVIGGWTDEEGNHRMFENLQQVQELCPDQFNPLFEQTKLKTLKSLREQLRESHPQLVELKVLMKKPRDNVAARVC